MTKLDSEANWATLKLVLWLWLKNGIVCLDVDCIADTAFWDKADSFNIIGVGIDGKLENFFVD